MSKENEIPILLAVDSSALSDLENLASNVPSEISIDVTADTSGFDALPFDDIPDEITPLIDVTESENSKKVTDALTFIALKEKVAWVIDIAGTAIDFVKDIGSMVVSPFLDVEDAVAKINAQTGTGTGIADLGQFIRDIQAADLGTSVDQIGQVVIAATQLGAPIDEATRAALTFTHTFDTQDPITVLTSLKGMADDFGISITSASDLMTVFFQQGGNKGGDALAAIEKYSTSWTDMGLSITEALSLVSSLMAGGVDTADAASKMVLSFDDAFTTAAADPNSQQAKLLKVMGITNPKDSGQAIGAETIDGFVSAFTTLPADQQDLVSGLFFGKTGKLDTSAIAGATTQSDMFKNYKDQAALAATEVDNSLRGAINDFITQVNATIATLLSSDAIDLPGKIAALKQGFQDAVDVLAKGGTVGEAVEVGLNMPGFNDAVNRFEASIGNFVISVLEIIAGIQDFLGKDSSGTRQQIKQAETQQLPFNLTVANPDEIAGEVNTAIARGLNSDDIAKATGVAVGELIDTGKSEDIAKAQTLVDSIKEINATQTPVLTAQAAGGANRQEALLALRLADNGDTSRIQEQIDKGNLTIPVSVDTTVMQKSIDDAVEAAKPAPGEGWWNGLKPPTNFVGTALGKDVGGTSRAGGWWDNLIPPPTTAETMQTWWDSMKPPTDSGGSLLGSLATDAATVFTDVATSAQTSLDATQTAMAATTTAAQEMDTNIATAMLTNTVTTSFEGVALSAGINFPIVLNWFHATEAGAAELDVIVSGRIGHLSGLLHDLQFLSAQVAQGVKDALAAGANLPGAGGGGGGGSTTVTTNVNQTNNNQNGAQTSVTPYQIAAAVNGGG